MTMLYLDDIQSKDNFEGKLECGSAQLNLFTNILYNDQPVLNVVRTQTQTIIAHKFFSFESELRHTHCAQVKNKDS